MPSHLHLCFWSFPKPCSDAVWDANACNWNDLPCQAGCSAAAETECYESPDPDRFWNQSTCSCDFAPYCPNGFDPIEGVCNGESPILIDVANNGYNLTNAANGVFFDLKNDGNKEKFSWTSVGSDDAFLVLDRNRNGVIDNGSELFGNHTEQPLSVPPKDRNGFRALAVFDDPANGGNSDGVIDNKDAVFADLRLWQDKNHNGLSESNELKTLVQLGVRMMDLDFKRAKKKDKHGNLFLYRAKVWRSRQEKTEARAEAEAEARGRGRAKRQKGRWAWDVWFVRAN